MISEVERQDLVSPERVDIVEQCLTNIGRVDLAKKVTKYKMSGETVYRYLLKVTGSNVHRAYERNKAYFDEM